MSVFLEQTIACLGTEIEQPGIVPGWVNGRSLLPMIYSPFCSISLSRLVHPCMG
jgi:hypothetical protein